MEQTRKPRYEAFRSLDRFSLFDLELVRLILRGGSVLDWHKLNLPRSEARAFCRALRLDLNDKDDIAMIERVRDESVVYLREILLFPVPRPVRKASFLELLEMAGNSSNRHRQLCACTLLKTMHIINHFDASEARQALAMTDQELFHAAERRIYQTISHMMANRLPIVEFMGGRKQRASMVTKLLSKDSPLSTQLFDKMRFRVITTTRDDILPIINYLARNLFPFNYLLAGESYNTLIPFASYCAEQDHLTKLVKKLQIDPEVENQLQPLSNRHSSPQYRMVHWVADMPLRVPNFENAFRTDGIDPIPRPIIYIRTELQILDRRSHRLNERSDASHHQYKQRQIKSVASRLKVGLRKAGGSRAS
ncbi:MAG: TIGR04552 family protein [Proteobacteria bacterium]|nr:TIGR04552 family protein [Pseudomonadota bacterium]